jgi:tRNA pseudouridine38-40 synthase
VDDIDSCAHIFEMNSNSNKIRFRARVAYCGTSYAGWQLQRHPTAGTSSSSSSSTVQGEVESALHRRFADSSSISSDISADKAQRRIPVVGAGRTDAGVHARGQAIHFDLHIGLEIPSHFSPPIVPNITYEKDEKENEVTTKILQIMPTFINDSIQRQYIDYCTNLEQSLNRLLPHDIRIFDLQLAPYNIVPSLATTPTSSSSSTLTRLRPWHAIQSAKRKWYSYRLALGPTLYDPTERYTRTHFINRSSSSMFSSKTDFADTDILHNNEATKLSVKGANNKNNNQSLHTITEQDINRLRSILTLYEGTHNFCAFGGQLDQNQKKRRVANNSNKKSNNSSSSSNNNDDYNNDDDDGFTINTIRTIYKVELVKESSSKYSNNIFDYNDNEKEEEDEYYYCINFLLDGALYKMIRNMVGTAMECWYGRLSVDRLVAMLQIDNNVNNDRKDNPCKPAPPEGLTLECVYYDDGF